jgi:hypothetical protein
VRWLVTDAFPLTASGKIRKDALRGRLARAAPPQAAAQPGPDQPAAGQPRTGQQGADR